MLPSPNLVIADRYRLERQIGRGGMGSVWLARHLGLDIPCAVKFIEGEYATLPEAQARFVREAKAAAQLRSPHVVQILDHGVWDGTPYMAMELLEGEDLGKRLGRIGRMSPQDVCVIITQVSRALTKAHGAGIVHRDLKPDNIFLVHDDDREIAKVLDFGIAKANTGGIDGSNTKTGAMLGTPYYMSPEQAQGVKAVDHRSDLWSLAVIVFQALTGKLPFESEALGDLLVKIIVQPIPVPSQVAPDLPAAFDRWWAKAANRDPSQRYQSAKECSDGLSLVFGQSQLTDVMDRSELRAAMGELGGVRRSNPANPLITPHPGTSPAAATMPFTPQPYATPHPGGAPPPGTPMPLPRGASPAPYGQNPTPEVTTGAPIAHTFNGTGGLPKSRAGLFVGLAAGGVLLSALLVGAVFAVKAKHSDAAAAASSASTAAAVAEAPPLASATLAPIVSASAAPDPVPPTGSATPPADSSVAVTPTPPSRPRPGAAAVPPTPPPQPAQPKPSSKKKPSEVDLGI
jgi:serine/threonine-protein kinase